jgi:hypothetical protein
LTLSVKSSNRNKSRKMILNRADQVAKEANKEEMVLEVAHGVEEVAHLEAGVEEVAHQEAGAEEVIHQEAEVEEAAHQAAAEVEEEVVLQALHALAKTPDKPTEANVESVLLISNLLN